MNKKFFGLLTIIILLATCGKTYAEDMTLQQLMQSEFGAFSSSQRQNVQSTPANPYEGMKLLEDRGLGSKVYSDGKTIYYTYTEPSEEELQRFRDENRW